MAVGGVIGLLTGSGPAAIGRLIVSIFINSIEAVGAFVWVRVWLGAHVSKEVVEGFPPAVADFDAPTAVVLIVVLLLVVATLTHVGPSASLAGVGGVLAPHAVSHTT